MQEPINIPYIAFEGATSRLERSNRRLWIVILVLIVMLIGSNIAWLVYEAQYEDFSITAEQDGEGVNIVGGGDIEYGAEGNN